MRKVVLQAVGLALLLFCPAAFSAGKAEHVVVVVWDGLRPDLISPEHTPALSRFTQDGVMFRNHHAVYPSSTEVNGTAIATGAYPEHGGIIANREYRPEINPQRLVDTQNCDVIRKGDEISGGHYLLRWTVAETLQSAGLKTAIAGTKPVAQLQDRRERPDNDNTGITLFDGRVLPASWQPTLDSLLGGFPGDESKQSLLPNEKRDEWTTRALIGPLWSNGVPAFSLLWLTEPDFSQHPGAPGSVKALAALESCDRKFAEVLAELDRRKLRDKTDVFVVSDHGFSSVEHGTDVCAGLQQAGFPAQRSFINPPTPGQILVDGAGGSVLFYIIGHDPATARGLVEFLQKQDFAGVIFTREKMEGTFALSDIHLQSPQPPDVVLSLRWSADRSKLGLPGLLVIDEENQSKRGDHASFSRFDLHSVLDAAGPDLKHGFTDTLPTGNTDLAPTILWLLGVKPKEPMDGRVLSEALTVKAPKAGRPVTRRLEARRPLENSTWSQYLQISRVNDTIYFDEGNGGIQAK